MRLHRIAILGTVVLVGLSSPALAVPIVLDFEGLQNNEAVLNFYDGGSGSLGSGPGPVSGIEFGSSALALIDFDAGGTGNFANEPSPDTILYFLDGSAAVMNVPAGFDTGFSFFYTTLSVPGSVTVYDGVGATGTVLATIPLPVPLSTCGLGGDPTGAFSCWTPVGVSFDGVAQSVGFGGTGNQIGFDNITIGSDVPGLPTPEPATLVLLTAGLAGAGLTCRRNLRKRRRERKTDEPHIG